MQTTLTNTDAIMPTATATPPATTPAAPLDLPPAGWSIPGPDANGFPGVRPVDGGLTVVFVSPRPLAPAERVAPLTNLRPAVVAACKDPDGPVMKYVALSEAARKHAAAAAERRAELQAAARELEAARERATVDGPAGDVLDHLLDVDGRAKAVRAELADMDRATDVAGPLLAKLRGEAERAVATAAKVALRARVRELVARRAAAAARLADVAGEVLDELLNVVGAMVTFDFESPGIIGNMHRAVLGGPGGRVPAETVAALDAGR